MTVAIVATIVTVVTTAIVATIAIAETKNSFVKRNLTFGGVLFFATLQKWWWRGGKNALHFNKILLVCRKLLLLQLHKFQNDVFLVYI